MREMSKILIISPDPEGRRTLELKLELSGHSVETAIDVREGLTFAKRMPCQMIVLDMIDTGPLDMGEVRMLAEYSKTKRGIKVTILLPRGQRDLKIRKLDWKPDLVVRKPYELGHLIRLVDEMVKGGS